MHDDPQTYPSLPNSEAEWGDLLATLPEAARRILSARVREADAALERVRDLADWHETKADKARRFPGEGNEAVMEKAARVHDDAARRLRAVLDTAPAPTDLDAEASLRAALHIPPTPESGDTVQVVASMWLIKSLLARTNLEMFPIPISSGDLPTFGVRAVLNDGDKRASGGER